MGKSGSNVFTVMVIGDNPEELMMQYDLNLKVERYLKYRYLDAEKMHKNSMTILGEMIKDPKRFNLNPINVDYLKKQLHTFEEMSSTDYYTMITNELYYDEKGDAWDDSNPNGKWSTFRIGRNLSIPFTLKNGEEVYSAMYEDINLDKLFMTNTDLYKTVWKLIIDGEEPIDEKERNIYNNMKGYYNHISKFKTQDDYVQYNCAYWTYAVLTKDGWFDIDDENNEQEWIKNYYKRFVEVLKPNEKLTLFECTRIKE